MTSSSPRVLHVLSQRPQLTGSGITLEALTARADAAGWEQAVVVGVPAGDAPSLAGIGPDRLWPLEFESEALPFAVPGMSDTMPYPSSRFSALKTDQLERYRGAFRRHLADAVARFRPDIIASHHLWLATAAAREVAPDIPITVHSHGTGLRQLDLCPHLADEVIAGVRTCDRFLALHDAHARDIAARFEVADDRVVVVGAGYRADLFFAADEPPSGHRVGYAGKLARAKGVPWLIEAFEALAERYPDATLHLAGGGDNEDAATVRALARDSARASSIELCGRLDQAGLAALLRGVDVFVLPSFYEGLPLVLVEALASGCRLVATDLPGVRELAPRLGDRLDIVAPPRRIGPDEPVAEDLPAFTAALTAAIGRALDSGHAGAAPAAMLRELSWDAVFERVERAWKSC